MKERIGPPKRSARAKGGTGEPDGVHSFAPLRRSDSLFRSLILLLGANLGDRVVTLRRAADLLAERIGPVIGQSALHETAPWGVTDQPTFLNQVLAVETTLKPLAVLAQTQAIEKELGRVRDVKWGARVIDVDILYYDQLILRTDTLTIPHPHLHQRRFTLVPLAEIAPAFIHPVLRKTTIELLAECKDTGEVSIFNPPVTSAPC